MTKPKRSCILLKIEDLTPGGDIEAARELFGEYAAALNFDLCFQDFEKEMAELPGEYSPPNGCIMLAKVGEKTCGCVALRRLDEDYCEMKRLYVRREYRGRGIGRSLAVAILDKARTLGYRGMRLDTLSSMKEAISLYKSLGFKEIAPYRFNPLEGAVYLELTLS